MKNYVFGILTENYAKEICDWKYEGDYSVYNFSDWGTVVKNGWDLSLRDKREKEFLSILLNGELIAYGRIIEDRGKTFIGVGLKPSWCGKGYGKDIMNLLIEECKKRFPDNPIALEVRIFNKRAVKCYQTVGFRIKDKYIKNTLNGKDEFYCMEYEKEPARKFV